MDDADAVALSEVDKLMDVESDGVDDGLHEGLCVVVSLIEGEGLTDNEFVFDCVGVNDFDNESLPDAESVAVRDTEFVLLGVRVEVGVEDFEIVSLGEVLSDRVLERVTLRVFVRDPEGVGFGPMVCDRDALFE